MEKVTEKKYIIIWDYLDNQGFAHINQTREFTDRDEANTAWLEMKHNSCFTNLRHKVIEPEKHIVRVAFKFYDYVVEGPVKTGDYIEVVSGGQVVKLEVLKTDVPKQNNINYVYAERVIRK